MARHIAQSEIQTVRARWYKAHFDNRAQAETLLRQQPDLARVYVYLCSRLEAPALGVMGNYERTATHPDGTAKLWPPREAFQLAQSRSDLDYFLVCPWYWSADGWAEFQRLWANLPEPVDFVHSPLCTTKYNMAVVHIGQVERPARKK